MVRWSCGGFARRCRVLHGQRGARWWFWSSSQTPIADQLLLAVTAHAETTPSPEAAAPSSDDASTSSTTPAEGDNAGAGQSAAFNPETGEINWDCPCLGGMADGPCGEDFKQAFSCFIFSEAEPKGIDCVEKFRGMQECFRKYPEIYGSGAFPFLLSPLVNAMLTFPDSTQMLRTSRRTRRMRGSTSLVGRKLRLPFRTSISWRRSRGRHPHTRRRR